MRSRWALCVVVSMSAISSAADDGHHPVSPVWLASQTKAGHFDLEILGAKPGDAVLVHRLFADPYEPGRLEDLTVVTCQSGAPCVKDMPTTPAIFLVEIRRDWANLDSREKTKVLQVVQKEIKQLPLPGWLEPQFVLEEFGDFNCSPDALHALSVSVQTRIVQEKCVAGSEDHRCKAFLGLAIRVSSAIRETTNKTLLECQALEGLFKANIGTGAELRDFEAFRLTSPAALTGSVFNYQRTEVAGPGETFFSSENFGQSGVHTNPAFPGAYSYIAINDFPHRLEPDLAWKTKVLDPKAAIVSVATLAGFAISLYAGGTPSLTVPKFQSEAGDSTPEKSGSNMLTLVPDGVGENTARLSRPKAVPLAPHPLAQALLEELLGKMVPIVPRGTRFVGPIHVAKDTQYEFSIIDKAPKARADGKFGAGIQQTVTYLPRNGWFATLIGGLQFNAVTDDVGIDFVWRAGGNPGGATKTYQLSPERQFGRYAAAVLGVFFAPRCISGNDYFYGAVVNIGFPLSGPVPLPQLTAGIGVRFPGGLLLSLEGGVRIFQRQLDRAGGTQIILSASDTAPTVPAELALAGIGGLSLTFDLGVVGDAIAKPIGELFTGKRQ